MRVRKTRKTNSRHAEEDISIAKLCFIKQFFTKQETDDRNTARNNTTYITFSINYA